MDKVTIVNSTLGKALGGAAGEGISMSEALHALKSSNVCSPFLTHATRLSLRLCHVAKGGRAELLLRSKWTLMVKDISWDFFLGLICDKISSVGNKLLTLNRSP